MSTDLQSRSLRQSETLRKHLRLAMATIIASVWLVALVIVQGSTANAGDESYRLAYLDECNPWYPHKDFPKLITPQWVGEEGVEAVIVLAIDDMRDPAKYEQYLRPILNRLKQIDGRAPVSIMTCDVKPDDAQLQSWLGEGLSIECHTIDHPCPILQGEFAKAKSTYDRCVDLMGQIPGNKPVAFRTPCCDSLNTVSPRFFSEIFSSTTENGNFLQIDSSVFTFFTSEDESLPKELVLDANGKERFWKYLPKNNKYGGNTHDNFVNYIKNYPYPYVINNSCWEIPCIAPSDWSAQHLHGINNPVTVEDWKAAIDLTVHKQGCFSLVFHPHGWIKPEQVVEMIDHAVAKHGNKVKFLNFREVAERLNRNLLHIGDEAGRRDDEFKLVDVDRDGLMDLIQGGMGEFGKWEDDRKVSPSKMWLWNAGTWQSSAFPTGFVGEKPQRIPYAYHVRFLALGPERPMCVLDLMTAPDTQLWRFDGEWKPSRISSALRERLEKYVPEIRVIDLNLDGYDELLLTSNLSDDSVLECGFSDLWHFDADVDRWLNVAMPFPDTLERFRPEATTFIDLNGDRLLDLVVSDRDHSSIWLMKSLETGWRAEDKIEVPSDSLRPIWTPGPCWFGHPWVIIDCPRSNGFFIHDRHFCWINEDTAKLPDLMYRVSWDEVLAEHKKATSDSAAEQRQKIAPGFSPGKETPKTKQAPEGRQNESSDEHPAAPSGLKDSSSFETPGSRPGLSSVVAPRLSRNEESQSTNGSPEYPPVPIGAAMVDITPDYPIRLTGYGNRMKESEGVAAKIHARALVIDVGPACRAGLPPKADPVSAHDSENKPTKSDDAPSNESQQAAKPRPAGVTYTVLITVDNCGVPLEMTEAVYERIAAKHDIPRERFAISSTHSHSAPWLRRFAPNIFAEVPDDHAAHLAQYEIELTDKLVEVVEKAIASQRPGHLSYGYGEAGFAMNRRALTDGKWSGFGEVPDGPTDQRVPVLAAHDTDGKLIAVLANYACHCTTETGEFNQISGDWAGFAAEMLEVDHPGAVALIAIGCGADANPSPRGTHEQAKVHGRTMADEVARVLASGAALAPRVSAPGATQTDKEQDILGGLTPSARQSLLGRINPAILCNMVRIDLPLAPLPNREDWERQAIEAGVTGSRARYFLKMLEDGNEIPTTVPNYPVQTWCFGDDLAMVFLGGEVVVDYSIRMNEMFDSDRLWINAYSNDVPCYIASARLLREGGYECDSSMLYYRRPTRLAPETEDLICDAVQKLLPHSFYSEALQQDFPAPKSPEESLKCMTTKPDLRVVLAASEPLIRDPVAFDWDEQGRLWVVEMGDYPSGDSSASGRASALREKTPEATDTKIAGSDLGGLTPSARPRHAGRVQLLEDTDKNGVYDKATTFLDNLAFPNGIHCWRGGVIVTRAPEIFYAEDTDGDGRADIRETLYKGFAEGNQQHRVNGLRWGLDGWLYLANGDSGGEIAATGYVPGASASGAASAPRENSAVTGEKEAESQESTDALGRLIPAARQSISLRGRDLRIHPDTNASDAASGQSQFGRERDDFGNWFGNNNSNPIWQYVLEDSYVRRNPFAKISQVTAQVAVVPGAAPVYPTSRTLARFNDFAYANRFTSACGTMIYRDNYLGDHYYGNAFTSEPVHNLVSRLVLTRDGYGFKGERAADEQQSEFLASSDNWFRPTMIRTGPDGALWIADMYRAVIEHPQWIPPEYQRKMNLYAGSDKGRIYRIVPASECCGENGLPDGNSTFSAAEQRQTVAPGFSPGNYAPNETQAPEGRQNLEVASSDESQQAAKSSPAGWTYFDMPWNEIPIEALVKRLTSPNGWWRDTAQRILLYRAEELIKDSGQLDRLRQVASTSKNPAVRVQSLHLVQQMLREDSDSLPLLEVAKSASIAAEPQVRRAAIEVVESMLVRKSDISDSALEVLESFIADTDAGVRLQLALSLGAARSESGAKLIGRMLRPDAGDTMLRNAALTSLAADNVGAVLAEVLDSSTDALNEALIGSLLAQAAAMGRTEQLAEPLTHLTQSISAETSASRLEFLSGLLSDVLSGDSASVLKQNEAFHIAAASASEVAASIAHNSEIDADRRAAAVRFAGVTQQFVSGSTLNPFDLLTPQTPITVQLAAVRVLGNRATPDSLHLLMDRWNSFAPGVRAEVLTVLMQRESSVSLLLDALQSSKLATADFDAVRRDALINHRTTSIAARARKLFEVTGASPREAVVQDFKSQISDLKSEISNDQRIASGKLVFEKRCAACHRLQDSGKEIGADLAALKDRSTDSLLTAILDPNRAVESKFLVYTAVTTDGLQHSGMLKGETGGSLTLIGSDGKEITVTRGDIEEFVGTNRSLMPEGLEKDLSARDLADVIAFVQSTGTPWKRFDGNAPETVRPADDGSLTLPASAAEIYGPNLVFEPKYSNLGFWTSAEDYAKWTFEIPRSGFWTVELDFACDDSTAGGVIRFNTGNRMLTARVPGSGTWDHYQTWQAGTIDLHRGRGQLILTANEKPPFALLDLRAVRLIPPKD
jgi:putative membrane-bound dehydrogenase-like protein